MTIHTEPTQTSQELPRAPYGIEVDLRRFAMMPIDVQLLRDSEFLVLASADEFRAQVMLFCAAWHRVPAGSLPNDDRLLAALAKVDQKTWKKIKIGALAGFVQHEDERLYHPVLTTSVLKSYAVMDANKNRTSAATAARKPRGVSRHDEENDQRDVDRDVDQRKGDEIKREEQPPQVGGDGGLQNSGEIGLGDMLAGTAGFADGALIASLNFVARGASHQQLERAAAAIIAGSHHANDLAAYSLSIAKRAALGLVTEVAVNNTSAEPLPWIGKNGWSIESAEFGLLAVEFGSLKSKKGILPPAAAQEIAARLRLNKLTLVQPITRTVSTESPQI